MVHWGQIVTSIVLMLGMCFAGMIFGGMVHFLYKKFTKSPATDSLLLIFFPALAGLSAGLIFLTVELSEIGIPDFVFWLVAVPAYILAIWAVGGCFTIFILMPALMLIGLVLGLSESGIKKSLESIDRNKGQSKGLLKILFLPITVTRTALLAFFEGIQFRQMSNKTIGFGVICLLLIAYMMIGQNAPTVTLNDKTLPELKIVTPDKVKGSVATFFSNETPSDQDLYNLAYALVAYSFTPLTLPSDYVDRHGASGGGIVSGLRNLTASMDNIAERRKALSRLEDKFRPQKQLAREKGLQIWHNLALRHHDQAVIGLAWYYGKVEQYDDAYFYRRIASIRGSEASAYWADKYSEKLTSVRVVELEKKIKGAANKTYSPKLEPSLLKDLAKSLKSIEALD